MKKLKLPKEIYSLECINSTITAFRDLARISVRTKSDLYYEIAFHNPVYDPELTAHEFENYLIDLTNKDKLW